MYKKAGLLLVGSLSQITDVEDRITLDDVESFMHLEAPISLIAVECLRDRQMQEFVERIISTLFSSFVLAHDDIENLTDDMGIDEDEMWELFKRLGYHKNNC